MSVVAFVAVLASILALPTPALTHGDEHVIKFTERCLALGDGAAPAGPTSRSPSRGRAR
jgi:hypothetical protein